MLRSGTQSRLLTTVQLIETLCVLILLSFHIAIPQTEVSGDVSGVWNIEGSPYIAVDSVIVPEGEQLTIDPGVVVRFEEHMVLIVNGLLRVVGTEDDSVFFLSNDPDNNLRWAGIQFQNADESGLVEYAHISGAGWDRAEREAKAILISRSSATIRNCLITNCVEGPNLVNPRWGTNCNCAGIWAWWAPEAIIENNTIEGNTGTAIWCSGEGTTTISGNLIQGNRGYGIDAYAGVEAIIWNNRIINNSFIGILLRNVLSTVENNTISGNTYGGIRSDGIRAIIKGNVVTANIIGSSGGGLKVMDGEAIVTGNIFAGNEAHAGGGIYFHEGSQTHFYNNVVYGNRSQDNPGGISVDDDCFHSIQNCILWNNQMDDINRNRASIGYSVIQQRFEGNGNLNEDPGFINPDEFDFHLSEDSPCIDAGNPEFPEDPDGTRADIGAFYFDQADGENRITVLLDEGWNLISINVSPPQEFYHEGEDRGPDIELMMEQLRIDEDNHHVLIMKNEMGQFYLPSFAHNDIPYWNLTEGYLVKVDADVEAVWSGEQIPADTNIPLEEGWNFAAYYPTYELNADAQEFYVLSPIIDHVLIAKDGYGHFLIPAWRFSDIPPWNETQGYQVKVDENVVLNYPDERMMMAGRAGIPACHSATDMNVTDKNVCPTGLTYSKTNRNMSLLVADFCTQTSNQQLTINSYELGAFTGNGLCVGSVSLTTDRNVCPTEEMWGMAIWGDDPTTEEIDGAVEGEPFTLRLWNRHEEQSVTTEIIEGETVYGTNGWCVVRLKHFATPSDFGFNTFYPNPFNGMTRFAFDLPEKSEVVLRIYDSSGRLVDRLVNGKMNAGRHHVSWNGSAHAAGIYFVKLHAGSFNATQKVLLLK